MKGPKERFAPKESLKPLPPTRRIVVNFQEGKKEHGKYQIRRTCVRKREFRKIKKKRERKGKREGEVC